MFNLVYSLEKITSIFKLNRHLGICKTKIFEDKKILENLVKQHEEKYNIYQVKYEIFIFFILNKYEKLVNFI